jgi:predicted AAA+ superfamily ATPase
MIKRTAEAELRRLAREFKVVVVNGPRQSGKTTLIRKVFPRKPYVLMEDPDIRAFASEDPRRFLDQYRTGAILDEIQRVPSIISYLQGIVDSRKEMGQFVLTGSCNFLLMESISQSLAGRAGHLELLPFSLDEIKAGSKCESNVDELIYKGAYPPIYDHKPRTDRWYNAYIATYLERDVRQLINLKDILSFQKFMGLCAANTSQLLNMQRIGADCGVHHNTVKAWMGILHASYIVFLLPPHHRNFRKRIVKSPKLYFYDTGIAARLLGIQSHEQVATHPLRGMLFENLVVSEMLKTRFNQGLKSNLYFWRSNTGIEIDIIADHGKSLLPVEIKSGETVNSDWFRNLSAWNTYAGKVAEPAILIYGGKRREQRKDAEVIPWMDMPSIADKI